MTREESPRTKRTPPGNPPGRLVVQTNVNRKCWKDGRLYREVARLTGFVLEVGDAFPPARSEEYVGVTITRPPEHSSHSPFWNKLRELEGREVGPSAL